MAYGQRDCLETHLISFVLIGEPDDFVVFLLLLHRHQLGPGSVKLLLQLDNYFHLIVALARGLSPSLVYVAQFIYFQGGRVSN